MSEMVCDCGTATPYQVYCLVDGRGTLVSRCRDCIAASGGEAFAGLIYETRRRNASRADFDVRNIAQPHGAICTVVTECGYGRRTVRLHIGLRGPMQAVEAARTALHVAYPGIRDAESLQSVTPPSDSPTN